MKPCFSVFITFALSLFNLHGQVAQAETADRTAQENPFMQNHRRFMTEIKNDNYQIKL
jgi:hypothetical protein